MNTLHFKRKLTSMRYLTYFLIVLFSCQSHFLAGQCVTDELSAQNCLDNPDQCALSVASRQDILNAYNEYKTDPSKYAASLAQVEQRVIPVVFHIMHQCGDEYITDEQCAAALAEANLDFHGNNYELNQFTDADLAPFDVDLGSFENFRFQLASIDEYGNATTGITRTINSHTYDGTRGEYPMKRVIQWDPSKYLNIWVVANTPNASGYAIYPKDTNSPDTRFRDGIVITHRYLGFIGSANTLEHRRRHTLGHEIGHWLGLKHTWDGFAGVNLASSCKVDDDLCDTPNSIGFSDPVYPKAIQFNYMNSAKNGTATYNQNGLGVGGTFSATSGGIVGHYVYDGITNYVNSIPNSCWCRVNLMLPLQPMVIFLLKMRIMTIP